MAREVLYEDWPDDDQFATYAEADAAQMAAFEKLREASDAVPPGEVVGALLSWQRGDGYAYYVVTSERPLTLAWVPFMDRWQVEEALIRGLRKQDVLDMIDADRRFRAIFTKDRS